ncbi:histone-lysine N-methyltransferase ASH1L [Fistulifera solaris]|uniref:Histone-lysine N-methyltransferase ASH1L n=1 Tax=Fistulifera solaris TaxID=1519565 RepID=A0A1Z5KQM9_FISSO|nr:histone-lysine N-methyltransferase ASH1L [Fistulifera solaris]|eukprot:GAX28487.1 histone-lysine N-methyltransferase ASH1L [Fistulifera solaris]
MTSPLAAPEAVIAASSESNDKTKNLCPSESKNIDHSNVLEATERRSGRKRKTNNADSDPKPKKQAKKEKGVEEDLDMTWICAECREAECLMHPEADELLVCEGSCVRVFHYPCAGLLKMPAKDETYVCKDCTEKRHACSICKEYGVDEEDVYKCSKPKCGLFFHESCLSMHNVDVSYIPVASASASASPISTLEAPSDRSKPIFTCPAHNCWTCTQLELKKEEEDEAKEAALQKGGKTKGKKKSKALPGFFCSKKESTLVRCLECPISYHISCIPLSAKFHELATLCHEHSAHAKLPELDLENSFQQQVESKADKYLAQSNANAASRKLRNTNNKNPCFPFSGGDLSKNEEKMLHILTPEADISGMDAASLLSTFCLPCTMRDEVHSKPPHYKHVHSLQYDPKNKPPRIPDSGGQCDCSDSCGENCYNRLVFTECYGDSNKNSKSNCSVGANCGNRSISQRKFIKCKPQREQGKGWGLVTLEKVRQGQLVIEYVGEVISKTMKEKRLQEWAREHPNDPNFYIMALSPGWFIDARETANLSRFINHSCDPNCIIHPINVGGQMRNAIVALREIARGEFLSYDYHFDTQQGDRFVCRCGAKNCRGTMKQTGGKGGNGKQVLKSASDMWEDAKSQFEKDKKFLEDFALDEQTRRLAVREVVPGSEGKDELIAYGPQPRNRNSVIRNGIFLWRNAVQGSRFDRRIARLSRK